MTHHNHSEYTEVAVRSWLKGSLSVEMDRTGSAGRRLVVFDDGSDEPLHLMDAPFGVEVIHHSKPGLPCGVVHTWNVILDEFLSRLDYDYLVITNNDVIFFPGWDVALVECFEKHEDCGIAGPVTNQPGHQPLQLVDSHPLPADDLKMFEECRQRWIQISREREMEAIVKIPFVNGFCFMLKRDRLAKPEYGDGCLHFGGMQGDKHYGAEDIYQHALQHGLRLFSYATNKSWVYHFKDVSLESHRWGRMGLRLEDLPRLSTA